MRRGREEREEKQKTGSERAIVELDLQGTYLKNESKAHRVSY